MRTFEEILVEDGMCCLFLSFKDQVAYLLKMCLRLRAVVIVGRTAPECLFIQLYGLTIGLSIYHRTQVRVTDG